MSEHRRYLVTGASRGLGRAITTRLLEAGHTVFAICRSDPPGFQHLRQAYPDTLHWCGFDLGLTSEIRSRLFGEMIPNHLPLHGLVNNAALAYDDLISNLDPEALETMFRLNVFASMELSRAIIRNFLLHETPGSLVHISSISTRIGYSGLAFYAATKGALEAFSLNAAREWGPRRIRSNTVACGFMDTSMSATLSPEQKERIRKRTALGAATDPRSVAETVAFLLSEMAASVTGQTWRVDSGAS